MEDRKKRFVIIDGNSVLHRAYHALPPLTTKKGELVNAVYGFLLVFFKAIKEFQPDFIAATFDLPSPTFRHIKFKAYKATRPKTPEELLRQLTKIKEVLRVFNISIFEKEGIEADDVIGVLAKLAQRQRVFPTVETIILSGDLDTLQLVNPQTKVYTLRKGVKDTILYDENKVSERYGGLTPSQLPDFKALKGDPSDNIPGVMGIGEKTAISLIKEFQSLENLYQELERKTERANKLKTKTREVLLQSKEQAFLSKMLATIRIDEQIDFSLQECQWKEYDRKKIIKLFKGLEFHSLIKRLPGASK